MGRTVCTEPQCLYKGALYLYLTVELYLYSLYGPYGLYRASVSVQGCTLPLPYSRAIPLLPLWAVQPVQSLSTCTRVHFTFTIKGKAALVYTLKEYRRNDFTAPLIRNFDIRKRGEVNFTLWPLTPGKTVPCIHWREDWLSPRASPDSLRKRLKSCSCQQSNQDLSASSS
jgi:hypothetical protein